MADGKTIDYMGRGFRDTQPASSMTLRFLQDIYRDAADHHGDHGHSRGAGDGREPECKQGRERERETGIECGGECGRGRGQEDEHDPKSEAGDNMQEFVPQTCAAEPEQQPEGPGQRLAEKGKRSAAEQPQRADAMDKGKDKVWEAHSSNPRAR